jgi:hypothetical protein
MTMFHSQREKMMQMVGQSIATYRNSDKTAADKRKLGKTIGLVAVNIATVNAWKLAFAVAILRKDEDWEDWATNAFSDLFGMVYFFGPIVRESVKAAARRYRGEKVYQQGVVSIPALKMAESVQAAATAWMNLVVELLDGKNIEKEAKIAVDKTWIATQYVIGGPFINVTEIAKAWAD